MTSNQKILLAYYGDDFTGSTDALEFLSRAGARSVLFLNNPSRQQLERYHEVDAIGIAGMTRALPPKEMSAILKKAFESLGELSPRHVHYKVCSTFDSSPQIGNIGIAIETGQKVFGGAFTPVLVGAPNLGRYSAFGNLYARMGIGSQGAIYRLDRHPSMSKHPITPSDESDLRLHLGKQTAQKMGLIDLIDLSQGAEGMRSKLDAEIKEGCSIVLFDAMYENQMELIGDVLDHSVPGESSLFSVGSSGIEKALGDYWANIGQLNKRTDWEPLKEVSPLLVLSGSVSPVTAQQIEWAMSNGFSEVPVAVEALEEHKTYEYIGRYQQQLAEFLSEGRSVILHTSKGPEDPRFKETQSFFDRRGWGELEIRSQTARLFGKILGQSARGALEKVSVERLVIAGGDTSSFVARELGIEAVEMIAPVFTGAPMCRAFAPGSPVDKIEVNLKGGQVGDETYFEALRNGKI
ncbi:four-carbon acid sugar kinase family protein [Marinoscillum sp. MHG1-6]|uniref:four-carbon acid sugar kinase family protein n=1 Tax=Marinoscillum sp. MHG1-6 TaxID=2959627 RepID=UPI0021588318|nr:four-carbon acid sugar kinase family protein [Marinoscillum sp. MHG1-6]